MPLLPHVTIDPQHPISRHCRNYRLWSRPSDEAGAYTAGCLVSLAWIVLGLAAMVYVRDPVLWWALIGGVDLLLRGGGIRTTILFIPLWVLALAMICGVLIERLL